MVRMRILMMRIRMRILMSRRKLLSREKYLRIWAFNLEGMRYGISVDGILQRANEQKSMTGVQLSRYPNSHFYTAKHPNFSFIRAVIILR